MAVSADDKNRYKKPPQEGGGGGPSDMNPMPGGGSWLQNLPWLHGGTSAGGGQPMPPAFGGGHPPIPFGMDTMHELMKNFVHRYPDQELPSGPGMRPELLQLIQQLTGGGGGGMGPGPIPGPPSFGPPPSPAPLPMPAGPGQMQPPGPQPMPLTSVSPDLVRLLSILQGPPRVAGVPGGPGLQR